MQGENTNYFISGLESASEGRVGTVRLELVKEERYLYGMKNFTDTKEAAQMVEPLFAHADRETVVVLSLDVRLKPVACFHSHPSGDAEPSKEDILITKRMQKVALNDKKRLTHEEVFEALQRDIDE